MSTIDIEAISSYCVAKAASSFVGQSSGGGVGLGAGSMKENADCNNFDANRDVEKLSIKALDGKTTPRIKAPNPKLVFRDRENIDGKRSADAKKKAVIDNSKDTSRLLRQKINKSHQLIQELKEAVIEKDRELKDMTTFVQIVKEILSVMASGGDSAAVEKRLDDMQLDRETACIIRDFVGMLKDDDMIVARTDEQASRQGAVIESLKRIVREKDQVCALPENLITSCSDANHLIYIKHNARIQCRPSQKWLISTT